MISRIAAALAITLSTLGASASAQPLTADEQDRVEEVLQDLAGEGEPGVAVGIVRGGEIVLEHYDGLADLSHSIAIGPQTRFNIASNAKQYVALMVLDLAEQDRVDLDAPLREYLPDTLRAISTPITVRELMTHRSGLRDVYDLWSLAGLTWWEEPLTNDDAMALLGRQCALNFSPGSEYLYSNSNYIFLAELIEAVSGESFPVYAEEFFSRLGMDDTGWRPRYAAIVPDRARAYGRWDGWLEDPALANLFGDGFLFSTLADQLHWESQLQGAPSSLPDAVIAASQQASLDTESGSYGAGLEHRDFRGLREISHVGSTGGYNAYLRRFPDEQLSIVVLGNTTEIGVVALGNNLADALVGDLYGDLPTYPAGPETTLARPVLTDILGLYDSGSSLIRIVERDGALYRELEGREPERLVHENGNIFAYETIPDLKIAFEPSDDGARGFRLFLPSQPVNAFTRLPPLPDDVAILRGMSGTYVNRETEAQLVLSIDGPEDVEIRLNDTEGSASVIAEDDLRWNGYRLRIRRNDAGDPVGLLLDGNRIRNVVFHKVPSGAQRLCSSL